MEDKRDILRNDKPFDYRVLKGDKAQILYRNRSIKVLSGREYFKLMNLIDRDDDYQLQLFLAKITGQFKMGNERFIKG